MALPPHDKELAAVGISVAAGCKPCTDHHLKAARETGAQDSEIGRAIAIGIEVRAAATQIMEAHALGQPRVVSATAEAAGASDRIDELIAVGAAFAVNCTSSLEMHLKAATQAGATERELKTVLALAVYIKGKGDSHVEKIRARLGDAAEVA